MLTVDNVGFKVAVMVGRN